MPLTLVDVNSQARSGTVRKRGQLWSDKKGENPFLRVVASRAEWWVRRCDVFGAQQAQGPGSSSVTFSPILFESQVWPTAHSTWLAMGRAQGSTAQSMRSTEQSLCPAASCL